MAGVEDGVRADVAPCCRRGGFVREVVVAGGGRGAGCVGGVGAGELDLDALGGFRGEVFEGLSDVEGGGEDGACGGEVGGFEEVGGEGVGGLERGDGAGAEGAHVGDCVQDLGRLLWSAS